MPFNICTVVEGNTLPVFLKNLDKAQRSASIVELRADFIKGINKEAAIKLAANTKLPSIFTCRHVKEGGEFKGSYKEQEEILNIALSKKFNYVDIAFNNLIIEELSASAKKKLLISYHNFKTTPSSIELIALLERMRETSPAIIKIATIVKSAKDIFTLAEILKQKKSNEKLIVIGMGNEGKLTRVMFPMMGSYLTYASIGGKAAPGIMTSEEIKTIHKIISKS